MNNDWGADDPIASKDNSEEWGINDPVASKDVETWGDNDPIAVGTLPNMNAPEDSFGHGLGTKILNRVGATNEGLAGKMEQYAAEVPQRLGNYTQSIDNGDAQQQAYNEYIAQKTGAKPHNFMGLLGASQDASNQDLQTRNANAGKGVGDLLDVATSAPIAALGSMTAPDGNISQQAQDLQKAAVLTQSQNQYNIPQGGAKYYTANTLEGLGTIAPALAASIATKNPEYVAGLMGLQGLGDEYATQREAGKSPSEAQGAAVAVGALNYGFGALPLGAALEGSGSLIKTVAKTTAEQVAINNILQDAQIGIEQGTLHPDQTFGDYLTKVANSTKDATVLGVINGLLFGTGGHFAGGHGAPVERENTPPPTSTEPILTYQPSLVDTNGNSRVSADGTTLAPQAERSATPVSPAPTPDSLGRIEPTFERQQLSPITDTDSAKTTLDAVKSGDTQNIHPDVVSDLAKNGALQQNDAGQLAVTDLGNRLLDELHQLNSHTETPENVIPAAPEVKATQSMSPELPKAANANAEDQMLSFKNETAPEVTPAISDFAAKRLADLEREHDALPPESPLRQQIVDEMHNIVQKAPAVEQSAKEGLLKSGDDNTVGGAQEATPQEEQALAEYQQSRASTKGMVNDVPFSITPKINKDTFFEGSKITPDSNASKLQLKESKTAPEVKMEPFGKDGLGIKRGEVQYGIYDGNKLIATYNGDTLLVDKNYRRKGIGTDLVAQYHNDKPNERSPEAFTKKSKFLFEKAIDKVNEGNGNSIDNKSEEYSTTPTEKFTANKDNIKTQLNNIIKRINPDVKTEFADKLFGEGEAIKASGGDSTERQEVAGSYNSAENLIKASLNADKWDVKDTAYHEAYHSVRDMVNATDDKILKKAFPGTDRLAQSEHEAIEFGRFMTEKNAPSFTPAVKRVFSAIRQALRDIGRTLKLGGFNSVEDIFNRIERGSVFEDYQKALKAGDIDALKQSNLTPQQQQQAIKEVSPALHDIVYKAMSDKDAEVLKDLNVEQNGTPQEQFTAYGSGVYDKAMTASYNLKSKLLSSAVNVTSKFVPEEWAKTHLEDAEQSIKNNVHEIQNNPKALNSAETLGRMMGQSVAGHMTWMEKSLNIPHIGKIRDRLFTTEGTESDKPPTFQEYINDKTNYYSNMLAHEFKSNKIKESDHAELVRLIQHPEDWKNTDMTKGVGRVAHVMSDMFENMRHDLAKAGIEVPETDGFFPRKYDIAKIVANELAFKRDATLAYQDTYKDDYAGMTPAQRDADIANRVNDWYSNILLNDVGVSKNDNNFTSTSTKPPAPSSFKQRTQSKATDDIMRNWLHQDPVDAMTSVIHQSARKGAWEKNFSDAIWENDKAQILKEGGNADIINEVAANIQSVTGQLGMQSGKPAKDISAALRYITAVTALPHAMFSHIGLNVNVGARAGSPIAILRGLAVATRQMFLNTDAARALRFRSEMIGITGRSAENLMLSQRTNLLPNGKLSFAAKKWYEKIGITNIIRWASESATNEGQYYLHYKTRDIAENTSTAKSSREHLINLGIPSAKVGEFSKWLQSNGGANIADPLIFDRTDPNAEMYRLAVQRFTTGGLSGYQPATRPRYANDPVKGSLYLISAYRQSYIQNTLLRNYRLASKGLYDIPEAALNVAKGVGYAGKAAIMGGRNIDLMKQRFNEASDVVKKNVASGDTWQDRRNNIAPQLLTLPLSILMARGIMELKDAINPPDKKRKHPWETAIDEANPFGDFAPAIKWIAGEKNYWNLGGPAVSEAQNYWDLVSNLNRLKGGPTKEKEAELKRIYNLGVAPAVSGTIASWVPGAIPPFLAIQYLNSHQAQHQFVKVFK